VAPYSGTYYVDASWNQGSFYKYYSLNIYEDKDTASSRTTPTNVIASLNAGNSVHVLQDKGFYTTLWDASGTDILDVQAQSESWTIILPNVALTTSVNTQVGLGLHYLGAPLSIR
jgi:hypothetical protein